MEKIYQIKTVDIAAQERIAWIFDEFEDIMVSVSGGKDSTVLCWMALQEARRRGRKIGIFFLDEEAVYMSTVRQVRYLMDLYPENTEKHWLQIPFHLTNSVSFRDSQLVCWDPTREKDWMRRKEPDGVQIPPWDVSRQHVRNKIKGFGFYDVIDNFQTANPGTCFLVGLRSDESFHRYSAVTKNPGHKDWTWTTKSNGVIQAYPLYDWKFDDVWTFIADNNIRYNKVYDYMYQKGISQTEIRVSSLVHEKSFKCLTELPEFEPETYDRLLRRVGGIQTGHIYGKDKKMLTARELPENYKTWREYRGFLLETYPDIEKKGIFVSRFAAQSDDEYTARQQCRQLLINDYENNIPVKKRGRDAQRETVKKWRNLL